MSSQYAQSEVSSELLYRAMMTRFLGPVIMHAFDDPDVTEIYTNPQDQRIWTIGSLLPQKQSPPVKLATGEGRGILSGAAQKQASGKPILHLLAGFLSMETRPALGSKTLGRATRRGVWIGTFVLVLLTLTTHMASSWYEIFAVSAAVAVAAFAITVFFDTSGRVKKDAKGRILISPWLAALLIGVLFVFEVLSSLLARWYEPATAWRAADIAAGVWVIAVATAWAVHRARRKS